MPGGTDFAALRQAVRRTDPAAFLVPARIVRRVIGHHREMSGFAAYALPHTSYAAPSKIVLEVVTRGELSLDPGVELPDIVVLVAEPDPTRVLPEKETLRLLWRRLFRGRVAAALEERVALGHLTRPAVLRRMDRLGQAFFDEVRAVLRHEDLLLPPGNDRTVYLEFAAHYLELRCFEPRLLQVFFPGAEDGDAVERLLGEDVDGEALLRATRLEGAPSPLAPAPAWTAAPSFLRAAPTLSATRRRRLARAALRASRSGNLVRASLRLRRVAEGGRPEDAGPWRRRADREVSRLASRFTSALPLPREREEDLREGLLALLPRAVTARWSRAARVLYDLQKACVDAERGTFTVDVVEWALTLGRRPVRRDLPLVEDTLIRRHLRRARRRLFRLRIPEGVRESLAGVVEETLHRVETRVRDTLRPVVDRVLDEVGHRARNLPERVSRNQLREEILDRIVERGHLRMGDLRDAFSRCRLKLPEAASPLDILVRDRLLRADRRLAASLDGIYRRGEFYIRALQRLSAACLGTWPGRLLVLFVAIPLGGAFLALEGLSHIATPLSHAFGGGALHLLGPESLAGTTAFLFLLVHSSRFRAHTTRLLRDLVRAAGTVFSWPGRLLGLPVVREILGSHPILLFFRIVLKPALYTALLLEGERFLGGAGARSLLRTAVVFLAVDLVVNTRLGRLAEELSGDWLARNWKYLRVHLIAGLVRLVLRFFRRLLDAFDGLIYTVDEWLCFRRGDTRGRTVFKALMGPPWFVVGYVLRFYVNLLIEPQVNPVKHFPVVTVSHKIILPFLPTITHALGTPLTPFVGKAVAYTFATSTVFLLPGVFGFLVWELKENWKLYELNRPRTLGPSVVGHHGENVPRLLRPGLHSGTIPKRYARLRRALTSPDPEARARRARRHREALHRAEEAVHRFADRELAALLRDAGAVEGAHAGPVTSGSNRIRIPVCSPRHPGLDLVISLEEQSGWLVARVSRPGFVAGLDPGDLAAVRNGLLGFYKAAGVQVVRDQIRAAIGPGPVSFDIVAEGLRIWPGDDFDEEVLYPLEGDRPFAPVSSPGRTRRLPRPLTPRDVFFTRSPITWRDWLRAWARNGRTILHPDLHVLPAGDGPSVTGR